LTSNQILKETVFYPKITADVFLIYWGIKKCFQANVV